MFEHWISPIRSARPDRAGRRSRSVPPDDSYTCASTKRRRSFVWGSRCQAESFDSHRRHLSKQVAGGSAAPSERETGRAIDAVNREVMCVSTSARSLPPAGIKVFSIITLNLPIPQKTRRAERGRRSEAEPHPSTVGKPGRTPHLLVGGKCQERFRLIAALLVAWTIEGSPARWRA